MSMREKNMNENIDFCEVCLDDKHYIVKEEEKIDYARGKEIKYIRKQAYCTECNSPMYIPQINDENLEALYSKIREVDDIISVDEIKEILVKYNIKKRPLSLLLGWGEVTITRYLDGDLPTKNYSDKLKLVLNNVDEMSNLLESNKDKISEIAYKKCREKINELKGCESAVSLDISKIESVAEYLIIKCGEITPLALQKLLYYSQAFCKLFTDSYLFEEDCEAWVHGPVYRCIYEKYRVFGRSVIDTDNNELLLDEIEEHVINSVVRYFGCYSAKSLEEMTHCEKPWIITRKGLKKNEACNRIIEKELIDSYFIEIKNKYNIVNIDDIKQYSSSLFKNIY